VTHSQPCGTVLACGLVEQVLAKCSAVAARAFFAPFCYDLIKGGTVFILEECDDVFDAQVRGYLFCMAQGLRPVPGYAFVDGYCNDVYVGTLTE